MHERFYCLRCLNGFPNPESLGNHMEYCEKHDVAKVVMPKMGNKLKFEHFYMSMRVPFIVYADFEAYTKPIDMSI